MRYRHLLDLLYENGKCTVYPNGGHFLYTSIYRRAAGMGLFFSRVEIYDWVMNCSFPLSPSYTISMYHISTILIYNLLLRQTFHSSPINFQLVSAGTISHGQTLSR